MHSILFSRITWQVLFQFINPAEKLGKFDYPNMHFLDSTEKQSAKADEPEHYDQRHEHTEHRHPTGKHRAHLTDEDQHLNSIYNNFQGNRHS